jgi:ribonucleoside-diphosphate reductase alpha chain
MHAVENDGDWDTTERVSGKTVKTYKARHLWDEIAKAAWSCGDPGVQFTDTINRWHTTPANGRITSSNPPHRTRTRTIKEQVQ